MTSDDMPNQEMIASIQDMRRPDAASSVQPGSAATNTAAAREIIRQITERAAVVLTREKAEMVMELKPESLGRLSLRVVTENGIVMAKFVAENTGPETAGIERCSCSGSLEAGDHRAGPQRVGKAGQQAAI